MNLDGTKALTDLESAFQAYENTGAKLLGYLPLMDGTKNNCATFLDLGAGAALPPTVNLVVGTTIPAGKSLVCFAAIYVNSALTQVSAYR